MEWGRAPRLAWLGLLAAGLAFPAHAQLSGSLTLASEYRLRGFSLTEQRPALTLGVAYDHPSGLYAGGTVIAHNPEGGEARILGHTEYVGYARRLREGGPSVDVGFANVDMSLYGGGGFRRPLEYRQVYVGIAQDALAARLSYSPDYPRHGVDTAYLDLNATLRPAEAWRLSGHLGVTERLGGTELRDGRSPRYDVRFAVARAFRRSEVQVAWTALSPRPKPHNDRSKAGFSIAASVFF